MFTKITSQTSFSSVKVSRMKVIMYFFLLCVLISCKSKETEVVLNEAEAENSVEELQEMIEAEKVEGISEFENNKITSKASSTEQKIVDSLRTNWQEGNTIFVENTLSWSKNQWLYFIEILDKNVDTFELKRYKAAFMLDKSKDADVAGSWNALIIEKKVSP